MNGDGHDQYNLWRSQAEDEESEDEESEDEAPGLDAARDDPEEDE